VVARGELAALTDLVERELRAEEGMVDGLRDALVGHVADEERLHLRMVAQPSGDV
jgi:hypothetical protein